MRSLLFIALATACLGGCALGPDGTGPPGPLVPVVEDNPVFVPIADPGCAWETVVDVVDDYFKIEREEPVRSIGGTITEGRLDTYPEVSPTLLEPWREDAESGSDRFENTLQSMRRRALVRAMPSGGGYLVEVVVLKELEDVPRPERATAGAATFRYDGTLTRVINPVTGQEVAKGWIPQGRDAALEQKIIRHLQARVGYYASPRPRPMPGPRPLPGPIGTAQPGPQHDAPAVHFCRYQTPEAPISNRPGSSDSAACGCGADCQSAASLAGWQPAPRCDCTPEQFAAVEPLLPADERPCFPIVGDLLRDATFDYRHFYSCRGVALMGLGLGTAAILANTNLDQQFQDWYRDDARSMSTDDVARVAKQFGNGLYVIPAFAAAALLGPFCRSAPAGAALNEWGDRCLRSVAVGGPPVLLFQWLLGASRPYETTADSRWKPFQDTNAVSGHAFIGALPFVNAAAMCDCAGWKATMYALSVLPAWSRINDSDHYLSQAILGWYFAYLAAKAVDSTEQSKREFAVIPLAMNDAVGIGVVGQW